MSESETPETQRQFPGSSFSNFSRLCLFVVLVLVIVLFFYISTKPKGSQEDLQGINWYEDVQKSRWGEDIQRAKDLVRDGNVTEAVDLLQKVKTKITDPGQMSVVDLDIASITLYRVDAESGAELFASIAGNPAYPLESRGYAMLVIADRFDAVREKKLLKPFFSESDFESKEGTVLIQDFYKQVYETYPFGLAAGKLALWHIIKNQKNGAISDSDYAVVSRYVDDIDTNLTLLKSSKAFQRYIPVTLLIKAALFRSLENIGRPELEPTDSVYLAAIASARAQGVFLTEQFGILLYADYLAEKGEERRVVVLLESLVGSTLDPVIQELLSSEEKALKSFPNLFEFQTQNLAVREVYESLF